MGELKLHRGDLVEVRSPREILATLDALGRYEGLAFMPEMIPFCGRRFTVQRRADKVCDTVDYTGSRRLRDGVIPCTYLPLAVDVPRFAPASLDQPRPIDVCNIGRRSTVMHQALLEEAERRQSFYYYDTVAASGADLKHRTFRVDSPHEHRRMLATILKHSCYYVANRGYVNKPEFTAGRDEISARFYEGAAAGTVMIGEAPRTEEFKRQFDWPDAVIHVPFDSPDIGRILADLNGDPQRLQAVRRNNVREAALRHDWLHRIRVVFDALDLVPTEEMRARAQRLDQIASQA